jgi:hypothetical protein
MPEMATTSILQGRLIKFGAQLDFQAEASPSRDRL